MRSVVVVLPASMWAMIPILRVLASGNSRMVGASAMAHSQCVQTGRARGSAVRRRVTGHGRADGSGRLIWAQSTADADALLFFNCAGSPAVVGERLVRLGHLVH